MSVIERTPHSPFAPTAPKGLEPRGSGPAGASALLLRVLRSLESAAIPFCYWKSVSRLADALAGAGDLDILVARTAADDLSRVMQSHGFKLWLDAPGRGHPAAVSFLGYDEERGAILHVHVTYRLALGHSLLKNFHAPIESELIARSVAHPHLPIRTLDPTSEALVLFLRRALEMGWTDPVALKRRRALKTKYATALTAIAADVDREALKRRVAAWLSPELAEAIAAALEADRVSWRLRRALKRALAPYRMYGGVEAAGRALSCSASLAIGVLNRRFVGAPRMMRRRRPGGGLLVSFIGVDGSGKSTQVREARKWLEPEIDVVGAYFGSGDGSASLVFRPFKAIAGFVSAMVRVKPKGSSHGKVSARPPGPLYSLLFAVWALAVALDKRVKLIAAQRAVSRGFVVITDRYPQNEILEFNDGPLLHRLALAPAWLRRLEESPYAMARRAPPDLVIKLRVGPATVAKREPDMAPALIEQRIEWLNELNFPGARVVSLDAMLPLVEVTRLAKRAIWEAL